MPVSARVVLEGCTFPNSSTGGLFSFSTLDPGGGDLEVVGCDLTNVTPLVRDSTTQAATARFVNCKLAASAVILATQTAANRSGAEAYVFDCASGDTHGLYGYYNALGQVVSDTGIFYTDGAAAQSWKITTTANASTEAPFVTAWINVYNSTLSAITPRLEVLRDGSTTAFKNSEVWAETSAKVTANSTRSTLYSGRRSITDFVAGTAGADLSAGAGLGSWTGEGGTAWSGKVDAGAVTPAELGDVRMRVSVALASTTVYVDPQIRT